MSAIQLTPAETYQYCPIRNVLSRFGDKWSLLILSTIYQSKDNCLRFSDLKRQMEDCSSKMLSQTLRNLEQNRLISRHQYPEIPPRVEYSLTPIGLSLMPVIENLITWATEHFQEIVSAWSFQPVFLLSRPTIAPTQTEAFLGWRLQGEIRIIREFFLWLS